ncbi:hypothetical protein HDV05_003229 [Chytridiales sp. JEL 0842]|nr:hypothetical protein HDV05_003229 [Chytridiales sp. JEL 0842]
MTHSRDTHSSESGSSRISRTASGVTAPTSRNSSQISSPKSKGKPSAPSSSSSSKLKESRSPPSSDADSNASNDESNESSSNDSEYDSDDDEGRKRSRKKKQKLKKKPTAGGKPKNISIPTTGRRVSISLQAAAAENRSNSILSRGPGNEQGLDDQQQYESIAKRRKNGPLPASDANRRQSTRVDSLTAEGHKIANGLNEDSNYPDGDTQKATAGETNDELKDMSNDDSEDRKYSIPARPRFVSASSALIQQFIKKLHDEGLGTPDAPDSKKKSLKVKKEEEEEEESKKKQNALLIPDIIASIAKKNDKRHLNLKPPSDVPPPGEMAVGRRGSIRIAQVPMKLTTSEMDLLAKTTGPFRAGPNDAHWKYLTRSKTVRLTGPNGTLPPTLTAQMYTSMGLQRKPFKKKGKDLSKRKRYIDGRNTAEERRKKHFTMRHRVSINGLSEYTVGKPTEGGFQKDELSYLKAANPNKYHKKKAKEAAKHFLMSRWENLEETRIHIVSRMASLKHYRVYLEDLKQQHDELKQKYEETVERVQGQITVILQENEEQSNEIAKLEKEQRRHKRRLRKQYEEFEATCRAEIARLERNVQMTTKAVQDISDDVERLRHFKVLFETNPEALQSQIVAEAAKRVKRKEEQELELVEVQKKWEREQAEVELGWMREVKVAIDGMNNTLADSIDFSPSGAYQSNRRLRREIAMHKEQQRRTKEDIDRIMLARERIKEAEKKTVDERRRVLNLKDCMTCTPDMEFEFSAKRAPARPEVVL